MPRGRPRKDAPTTVGVAVAADHRDEPEPESAISSLPKIEHIKRTKGRMYWIGLLNSCPVDVISAGTSFCKRTSPPDMSHPDNQPGGSMTDTVRHQLRGQKVEISKELYETIRLKVATRVVRSSTGNPDDRGRKVKRYASVRVTHRLEPDDMTKPFNLRTKQNWQQNPGYTPQPNDEPAAKYMYMIPVDKLTAESIGDPNYEPPPLSETDPELAA